MIRTFPQWRHHELQRRDLNHDPTEGEFFKIEGLADALVREAGQNTLDARADSEGAPARLRFTIRDGDHALPPNVARDFLQGLIPHLEVPGTGLVDPPNIEEPMPYLLVEDYGTRGLCGDPEQDADREDGEARNDFFYFWRNRGRSDKSLTDRGRWGVGKTVFPASSRINAIWGLTVRIDDKRKLLMGQSVLKIHQLEAEGARYSPFGFYGTFEEDGFQLPLESPEHVQPFEHAFVIDRGDQPGLSVVVPYPDSEIQIDDLARSAIQHYFHPILAGELVVEIAYGDALVYELQSNSLADVVERITWQGTGVTIDELRDLFTFTEWSLTAPDHQYIRLRAPREDRAPAWSEELFPEGMLSELRKRYEAGEHLPLRVPVYVKRNDVAARLSYFDAFIMRDQQLPEGREHYIRQGLTIPHIRRLNRKGVHALLVVKEPALSSLIGDAENPAHTDWQENSDRVKRNFTHGPYTVRFVRNGLAQLVSYLTPSPEGLDENLLRDIFFIEVEGNGEDFVTDDEGGEGETGNGGQEGEEDPVETPPPPPPPPPSDPDFAIVKRERGFAVKKNPRSPIPQGGRLEVAYSTRRGDSFRRYSSFDFDFAVDDLQVESEGLTITSRSGNTITFKVDNPEFALSVYGFDPNRDLEIRATTNIEPDDD